MGLTQDQVSKEFGKYFSLEIFKTCLDEFLSNLNIKAGCSLDRRLEWIGSRHCFQLNYGMVYVPQSWQVTFPPGYNFSSYGLQKVHVKGAFTILMPYFLCEGLSSSPVTEA